MIAPVPGALVDPVARAEKKRAALEADSRKAEKELQAKRLRVAEAEAGNRKNR